MWAASLASAIAHPAAPRRVGRNAGVGHHHPRVATDVLELDTNLGRGGMPSGHAQIRGRQHVAVRVGHGLGVDQSLVLDDLAVLTGEPHLHRSVRGPHLHAHQTAAADVHPCDGCQTGARPGRSFVA